jgi:hypothetical protein
MKPERWQQLDKLFHSALERESHQRAAYLDEVSAGDEALRKQVEALLVAHQEAGSLIDNPAFEVEALAREQVSQRANSLAGQTIGHYRIIELLGAWHGRGLLEVAEGPFPGSKQSGGFGSAPQTARDLPPFHRSLPQDSRHQCADPPSNPELVLAT